MCFPGEGLLSSRRIGCPKSQRAAALPLPAVPLAHHVRTGLINWRKGNACRRGIMPFDRSLCFCGRSRKGASCQIATRHRSPRPGCDPKLHHPGWGADLSRRLRSGRSADRPRRPSCLRRSIQVWRRVIRGDSAPSPPTGVHRLRDGREGVSPILICSARKSRKTRIRSGRSPPWPR
jgi:hypothetical protein